MDLNNLDFEDKIIMEAISDFEEQLNKTITRVETYLYELKDFRALFIEYTKAKERRKRREAEAKAQKQKKGESQNERKRNI